MKKKIYEVVTVGRRKRFPNRNNAEYRIIEDYPFRNGEVYWAGDYEVEVVMVREINKKKLGEYYPSLVLKRTT